MCKTWATNLLLLLRMVMSMLRHQKAFRGLREGSVVFTILRYKNWYYVYDEAGKKIGGLSRSSVGDMKGWGSDFFVAKYYSFYRIYDAKGKVLKAMNVSDIGEIVGVSGNTITSRKGSWIFTWNKDGKKLSARSVN
jgi:hypothetical protein